MLPDLTPSAYCVDAQKALAFGGISESQPKDANPHIECGIRETQGWVVNKNDSKLQEAAVTAGAEEVTLEIRT